MVENIATPCLSRMSLPIKLNIYLRATIAFLIVCICFAIVDIA